MKGADARMWSETKRWASWKRYHARHRYNRTIDRAMGVYRRVRFPGEHDRVQLDAENFVRNRVSLQNETQEIIFHLKDRP